MKNVIFCPNWSKNNPYQKLLANSVASNFNVSFSEIPLSSLPFSALLKENPNTDIIHVHWLTEVIQRILWAKSDAVFYTKLLLLVTDIANVRRKGVHVVWTIHNRYSHQQFDKKREEIIRKLFCKCVNRVIVHSLSAAKSLTPIYGKRFLDKVTIIPHGNYDGCYPKPKIISDSLSDSSEKPIRLLFFGTLRPYKGVLQLIDCYKIAAPENTQLVIAGSTPDENYKSQIKKAAANCPQIILKLGYLDDQLLIDSIEDADAIIVPFEDTLTSGSVILAMTQSKAIIAPKAAHIFDCIPTDNSLFYNDQNELEALFQKLHKYDFAKLGRQNREAANQFNWDAIGLKLAKLYGRLP
ncbi:glycosyltransferase [Alteromonas sp.]|uniref:glycosyltransferase n=1 Tax=Alteromonas sp. TaxID=232 RepID=UPI000B6E270B|nr:glycosyltransferase [Alteromonas sp.]MAI37321.1 hypothetical protein [Alteromonas sp.]OUX88905.1 MAG: hypothetical protein CBB95_06675 [Alteromonas sp. TMED35]|tara:strand:+ start:19997 stop:21055 length:1059 start_codon:yes stop_codon:yes gene_type:complete